MRELASAARIQALMRELGLVVRQPTRVYLVGGATAVLSGWRETTIDVDMKFIPDSDEIFRALPRLKEELRLNIEIASPDHFIPPLPGWESRSPFIRREGSIDWHHYDPYAQALAKIERDHERDRADVRAMFRLGWVKSEQLRDLFQAIRPDLIRYPAVDPGAFAIRVENAIAAAALSRDH